MLLKIFNKFDHFFDWMMSACLGFACAVLLFHLGSGLVKYAARQEHKVRIVKAALIETSDTERKDYDVCK